MVAAAAAAVAAVVVVVEKKTFQYSPVRKACVAGVFLVATKNLVAFDWLHLFSFVYISLCNASVLVLLLGCQTLDQQQYPDDGGRLMMKNWNPSSGLPHLSFLT